MPVPHCSTEPAPAPDALVEFHTVVDGELHILRSAMARRDEHHDREVHQTQERLHRRDGGPGVEHDPRRHAGVACVEINQCVGCTRQFFTKSFLGDGHGRPGSVERRGTGIATPSSRRRVDGVEDDAMIQHGRAVKF